LTHALAAYRAAFICYKLQALYGFHLLEEAITQIRDEMAISELGV